MSSRDAAVSTAEDGGTPGRAVRAGGIEIDPRMSSGEALRRIGAACLDHIRCNEAAARAGNADAIHQLRVGMRRLRAALSTFRKLLPRNERRRAARDLRRWAAALAAIRDLDVFERTLLAPCGEKFGDLAGLAALRAAVAHRREAAFRNAIDTLAAPRYAASIGRIAQWLEDIGRPGEAAAKALGAPIGAIAVALLDRRRRAALRRARRFAAQSAPTRHELRIALKKLRYSVEMLGSLYEREALAAFTRPLRRLQDELGATNDLRVGRDIVAALTKSKAARRAIGDAGRVVLDWHERRLRQREPRLRKHLDRLRTADRFWSDA